jgi:hypothetical protein
MKRIDCTKARAHRVSKSRVMPCSWHCMHRLSISCMSSNWLTARFSNALPPPCASFEFPSAVIFDDADADAGLLCRNASANSARAPPTAPAITERLTFSCCRRIVAAMEAAAAAASALEEEEEEEEEEETAASEQAAVAELDVDSDDMSGGMKRRTQEGSVE